MKILVVVDMQNDFLTGALRNEEGIKIIPNVINKIKEYKNNGYDVIATRDTHYENYLETQEGINLPFVHCVKDSYGWQINDQVKESLGDCLIFDKPTFGSIELAHYLSNKYKNIENELEIEFIGVCTDICVISNVMLVKASLPEAKIIVDASCCAGVSVSSHNASLIAMKSCQVKVIGE